MLDIQNLSHTYHDGTVALRNVSLHIETGCAVGIVGPNGAGKSTLVNHLNGYLLPGCGTVVVDTVELSARTRETIRRTVGIVFQNPDDQLFMPRVVDDIAFGPRNLGLNEHEIAHRIDHLLHDLQLTEIANRSPFHLSQGQKRFAAIATVLAMQPSVVVMDEPTADLDMRHRRMLIGLVRSLEATRVIVSHDLDFIWDTCQQAILLSGGTVVAQGIAHEILSNAPLLESHGLELPLRLQGQRS
jgi:cobalt/nickel transport system ATP-binding protein